MDSDRDPSDSPEARVKSDSKPDLTKAGIVSAPEAADAPPEEPAGAEDDDEARLPEPAEELSEETFEAGSESRLAVGHTAKIGVLRGDSTETVDVPVADIGQTPSSE